MTKLLALKKRIALTHRIQSIVHSMDIVSLQKTKVALHELTLKTKYLDAVTSLFNKIISLVPAQHSRRLYLKAHQPSKEIVFIFGPQAGFVGAVQNTCMTYVQDFLTQQQHQNLHLLVLSNRMYHALQTVVAKAYPQVTLQEIQAEDLRHWITTQWQDFMEQRNTKITLIYPYFLNIFTYVPKTEIFFPLHAKMNLTPQYDPLPLHQAQQALSTVMKLFLDAQSAFCLAHLRVVEYSARYVAAHAAAQACEDKEKALHLLYNKTRQYNITQELTEASAGNFAYDDQ